MVDGSIPPPLRAGQSVQRSQQMPRSHGLGSDANQIVAEEVENEAKAPSALM